ncbi:MAG: hypothetical protein KJO32_11010 [Deltaproteobacteria bacterium]|nr:hypothetical protein [Deltaproteobacteria bacterium]
MIRRFICHCIFISAAIMLLGGSCSAEENVAAEPNHNSLERQLEIGRHEKLAAIKKQADSHLADFSTDGCSGGLSAGWEYLADKVPKLQSVHGARPPWESCCIEHDRLYHPAGTMETSAEQSFSLRQQADADLRSCVFDTGALRTPELAAEYDLSPKEVELVYAAIAELMYRAVRLGGVPCTGFSWRWGYGWPSCE